MQACTQKYVDQYTLPPEFRMNLRMGQAITTVGLAILYVPILPISAFIGFVGMVIQYAVDQYLALRHSSRPRAFQVEAFYGANYLLRLLPLIQLFLILAFYFGEIAFIPSVVGLVIWIVACIVPLTTHIRQLEYTKWVEGGRPKCAPACCLAVIPWNCMMWKGLLQTTRAWKANTKSCIEGRRVQ
jgi:F0F1-type ATP synthase assembly protein I